MTSTLAEALIQKTLFVEKIPEISARKTNALERKGDSRTPRRSELLYKLDQPYNMMLVKNENEWEEEVL